MIYVPGFMVYCVVVATTLTAAYHFNYYYDNVVARYGEYVGRVIRASFINSTVWNTLSFK